MTIKESATRIIRKAIKNGFEPVPNKKVTYVSVTIQNQSSSYVSFTITDKGKNFAILVGFNDVLFNHDFARALWGGLEDVDGDRAYEHYLKEIATLATINGRISYINSSL